MNKQMQILIVDDHGSMRRILRGLLAELGYSNVEEADDGARALEMLRTLPFDLVITDRYMPGMDGMELLRTIRVDAALSSIPVLLVTAEQNREQIMEAIKAKVSGYIIKPINVSVLQDKLERIFIQA